MSEVKSLVALACERVLLRTSGEEFLQGVRFLYVAGLAPKRLSVMETSKGKFILQFHSSCDRRPFAANYPSLAHLLRGISHLRAWHLQSVEFVNVGFYMRDIPLLETAVENLTLELVLLRNCAFPGVSAGLEAIRFLTAINRQEKTLVCEYGDEKLRDLVRPPPAVMCDAQQQTPAARHSFIDILALDHMMAEVRKELVVRGGLKLKKDPGVFKSSKKKKEKKQEERDEQQPASKDAPSSSGTTLKKTPAEIAFMKRQMATTNMRLIKKAAISHREKVEAFNEKMGALTEFNDIPKVSWTK